MASMGESDQDRKPNPLANANIISKLFFYWVAPLFRAGYRKKAVEQNDLYECLPEDSSRKLGSILASKWGKQLEKRKCGERPNLAAAMTSSFGAVFLLYGVGFFLEEVTRIIQPLLLKWLTTYFSPESTVTRVQAYLYAMGLGLSSLVQCLLHGPNFFVVMRLGMRVRIALCSLIYNHTLKLSHTSLGMTTTGHVNNLMTNDVNRFDELFNFLHYIWLGPLQAAVVLVLLWKEIGYTSLPGYVILFLLLPVNMGLAKLFAVLREKTAKFTDNRVSIMTEVITAMRVIKMYTWEKPFGELIAQVRRSEIMKIIAASYPLSINSTMGTIGNRLLDVGMIIFYALTAPSIETAKIFTIVSFCNTVRRSFLKFFPRSIQLLSECRVSVRRIEEYLLLEEKRLSADTISVLKSTEDGGITVNNLTCSWDENAGKNKKGNLSDTLHLEDITFQVNQKELLAVVGPVGAGKSSLLMAILGELPSLHGKIGLAGRVAYASQQPWVFSATVRDNITFGRPFVEMKYQTIVRVCSLNQDINELPSGDLTVIGERGVTLSGGQKARINLARALYDDADIYLLDDPLSAVDSEVSRHIYEKCIKEYLADKPRILVTHQLQFLHDAEQILVLKEGRVDGLGSLEELQARGIEFSALMHRDDDEDDDDAEMDEDDNSINSNTTLARLASGSRKRACSSVRRKQKKDKKEENSDQKSGFEKESVKQGNIGLTTYLKYFRAGSGVIRLLCMILFLLGTQLLLMMSDFWLAYWADTEEARQQGTTTTGYKFLSRFNLTTEASAGVYGGIIASLMLVGIVRAFIAFHIMIAASKVLHNRMFAAVVRSPIRFFDTTPTGRIQNRFTKDIGIMDDLLPYTFFDFIQMSLQIIGTVLITCVISYFTVILVVPLLVFLLVITRYALITTTAVKRLDGIARSPVFSHTTNSLQGLWIIRAYRKEKDFIAEFNVRQDHHTEAWFMYIATNRWLGLRLDLMVFVFLSGVALSCVPLADSLDAGKVGLILTNSLALSGMFQYCVRLSAMLENQMTSVERVLEYTNLPPEPSLENHDHKPPPDWPHEGAITFDNLSLSYSSDSPRVLKDISCEIRPKEKIGIVGRTGAGKSSLISALFRLSELAGGVVIDDVDTSTLGLHDVRKRVSIIPQDPVIFSGSLRRNLDPFSKHDDVTLWAALQDVRLDSAVKENPAKLDMEVGEGGSNFSVGQRQLICLARAILKKNRILVLDEATANVDPKTDALIQETIRSKFQDCTVLTIAHRLHTIIDSDRIMVLDTGRLVELDTPHALLNDSTSMFTRLIEQTGKATATKLKALAKENLNQDMLNAQPNDLNQNFYFIVLHPSSHGYGFQIQEASNNDNCNNNEHHANIVVKQITKPTNGTDSGLQIGDVILSVNGRSVRELTNAHVEDILENSNTDLMLIVRRNQSDVEVENGLSGGHHGYDNFGYEKSSDIEDSSVRRQSLGDKSHIQMIHLNVEGRPNKTVALNGNAPTQQWNITF